MGEGGHWRKVFGAAYIIGYWGYVGFAAIKLWPQYELFEWFTFVLVHAAVATVWPVGFMLWYVGYFS